MEQPPSGTRPWRARLLLSLLWIASVHGAGLYLFTTGFFLTRFEVPDVSECRVSPVATSSSSAPVPSRLRSEDGVPPTVDDGSTGCWMPRRFRRVVFVVVDALRFDFVASDASESSSFYLNRLPILNDTLHAQPQNALLLKFVADPPTMTMQRLKGLTTGSLPTFLDIKDNMASSEITEDNLLKQMHNARRPIVFMGDDTWEALYEPLFTRKYAFESFNVKDLHSVDRGVVANLFPELQRTDWDLLIAHFLGVDHVGHTHGPSSAFMTEKLDEMNGVLAKLIQELQHQEEETLLLVMGDHGMSADGNHGGASDEETGAALFMYSTSKLVDRTASGSATRWSNEVPQVDLVPTLALLAGLPIPFGSLGAVIPQLFTDRETLMEALRLNVAQVRRYLLTYSAASKLPESDYDHLERIYEEIKRLDETETADVELLARKHQIYLREALALGRSIWTQFDLISMGWGILLLIVGQLLALVTLTSDPLTLKFNSVVAGGLGGAVIGAVLPPVADILPRLMFPRMVAFAALGSSCGPLLRSVSFGSWPLCSLTPSASTVVAFITVLLHALALLSNSYIVAEDMVMLFLTTTVGLFLAWFAQRHAPIQDKSPAVAAAAVFLIASRVTSAVDPPNIIQSTVSLSRTWLPLVIIAIYCFYVVIKSPRGSKLRSISTVSPVAFSTVACALYWHFSPISSSLGRLWLPRSVFLLLLAVIVRRGFVAWGLRSLSPLESRDTQTSFTVQLTLAFSLVLGPSSPLTTLCITLAHLSFARVAQLSHSSKQGEAVPVAWVLLWCHVCYQSFFTTGHQNTFTSLQNSSAFVGFDDFRFYWAGALLAWNTFGSYALALLGALPFFFASRAPAAPTRALLAVVSYFALNALVSTAFVALQRRHLMVWAIFAPKFIFDGAALLVVELLAIVTTAIGSDGGGSKIL